MGQSQPMRVNGLPIIKMMPVRPLSVIWDGYSPSTISRRHTHNDALSHLSVYLFRHRIVLPLICVDCLLI